MAIRVTPKELSRDLVRRFRKLPKLIEKSMRKAAQRGRTILVRRTPVDTGLMKNAWRVTKGISVEIVNDAPHAGIIEEGARPHKVNRQGIEALTAWAQRKLGASLEEARSVAWGIAKKLEKEGQPGKFIVRDALDDLTQATADTVNLELARQARRKV